MSNSPKQQMLHALVSAMQAEREGHYFYMMAAASTKDTKGKETFERLAAEELDHFELLRAQYKSLEETGKGDPSISTGPKPDPSATGSFFSKNLTDRIGGAHYEMTALSIAAQLEKSAEDFYKKSAQNSEDTEIKRFFLELADWEAGHYHAILAQQQDLQEDYWDAGGFAPF